MTPDEIQTLTDGGQVFKETESYNLFWVATPHSGKTALVYGNDIWRHNGDNALIPGQKLSYKGFITDGKFYSPSEAKAISEELTADINAALIEAIPTEQAAEANAADMSEWRRKQTDEYKEYDYTRDARDAFYKDEPPALKLYGGKEFSQADLIRYIETPAEAVADFRKAYAESRAYEILIDYIQHNRTMAAYRAIIENPDDEAHLIRAISASITDEKTARIELVNGETVKAEAHAIKHMTSSGDISDWYVVASDRDKLPKDERGRAQDIKAADIATIYHGQKTLYRAA